MGNLITVAAVAGVLALLLMKKNVPSGPALVITWAPGAATDVIDEDGTLRDWALASIGFPWKSAGTDGDVEWIHVDAPAAALEGVAGMVATQEGVVAATYQA